jgi:hypothetical protein
MGRLWPFGLGHLTTKPPFSITSGALDLRMKLTRDEQASASNKSAEIAASGARAWVGPLTATVGSIQKDKSIQGTIPYQNTGREPAANFFPSFSEKLYSDKEWNGGVASEDIRSMSAECLKIKDLPNGLQVVYPSTGTSTYQFSFNTERGDTKIIVDDDMVAGKKTFALLGCFTYKSAREFHHSAFCFYYLANTTTLPNLNICNVGNDAD